MTRRVTCRDLNYEILIMSEHAEQDNAENYQAASGQVEPMVMFTACWDCSIRIGEECGIDGHEVYESSISCDEFSET